MKENKNKPGTETEMQDLINKFQAKPVETENNENENTESQNTETNKNTESENNNESTNNLINKFGVITKTTDTASREPINIAKIKEIEKELKKGEVIQVTDIKEFAKLIGLDSENANAVTIRNKLYRSYQKQEINLKPMLKDRQLYLVRK